MIQATDLTKRFGKRVAVDAASVSVKASNVFGLLGPNAAGKSTLIRMMCGIIKSDGGEVSINGKAVPDARGDFGYVAQFFGQYEELTVWENLAFYARMYGVTDKDRLNQLLARYELTPFKKQAAGKLSGGYQRRLALACALAHDPKVLFLDEPTAGIDPVTRKLLWDDFYELSSEGKTLFVTTHYMEEAQRCHQLAFLSHGRIVGEGTPDTIKDALGDVGVFMTHMPYRPDVRDALLALDGLVLLNQFGDELRVVARPSLTQETVQETLERIAGAAVALTRTEPNLEDVFISLTQDTREPQ